MSWRWLLVLLPAATGLGSLILLTRADVINFRISLRRDIDVILLLSGAVLSLAVAAVFIVKESMDELAEQGIKKARRDTYAEHQRFLRRLDHEMKNPITAIRAGLANLSGADDPQQTQEIRGTLDLQARRLAQLVSNLRKITNLEEEFLDLSLTDLRTLLEEALSLAQGRPAADRRLALTLPDSGYPLPTIRCDRDLLLLAIGALLDNAIKFTRPGDSITLVGFVDTGRVYVTVSDSGIGIAEADLPFVWEELYRGANARDLSGNGIGLPLARAIIIRHDGDITIDSIEGQGTTVTFSLPLEGISDL